MNKDLDLTKETLDLLLGWLDPDRDRAGAKYEEIRRRLIRLFICRGCTEAEDLADETINRVISKLCEVAKGYQGDPALFFYGVAKKIYLEYVRRKAKPIANVSAAGPGRPEQDYECLDRCMQTLPPDQRDLVLQYYREDKRAKIDNRRQLALRLGIGINALRIRAHRIKAALQECVEKCVTEEASA
jgi:DNA-directed RNA polymerase specialized sigma24 family protein